METIFITAADCIVITIPSLLRSGVVVVGSTTGILFLLSQSLLLPKFRSPILKPDLKNNKAEALITTV